MQLTVLLVALICVRWFGIPSWLHFDQWLKPWMSAISGKSLQDKPWPYWLIVVLVPLAVAAYALQWSAEHSRLLEFIVTAIILLYSIGRDDFKSQLQSFISAVRGDDKDAIVRAAEDLRASPADEILSEDSHELNHQSLLNAAYRAMERIFVVFFWFAMLGPLAALAYRLLRVCYTEHLAIKAAGLATAEDAPADPGVQADQTAQEPDEGDSIAESTELSNLDVSSATADQESVEQKETPVSTKPLTQLIWLLEWPVVRVLGLSFAITGNFLSCMQRWKDSLLCFKTPSKKVLGNAVGGALNIDVDCKLDCDSICCEMEALQSLFFRTGLFWLSFLAVYLMLAL